MHHVTVAHSRETRHKRKVVVTVANDELQKIPEADRRAVLGKYIVAALIELGIAKRPEAQPDPA